MENEYGEKLDRNRYSRSIIQENVGEQCFWCKQKYVELVRHEVIHGTGRRNLSKAYGLWITVCPGCHDFIHRNPANQKVQELMQEAQRQAMKKYGWSEKGFIKIFGKNYL